MMIKRKDEPNPYPNYYIRYNITEQRIIIPRILPYLIHKNNIAQTVLKLLDYRQHHPYPSEQEKIEREKFYLQIEEEYRCAVIKSKPWLLTIIQRGGKLKNRNLSLVKSYHEHTYIRNYEPNRYKDSTSPSTSCSESGEKEKQK